MLLFSALALACALAACGREEQAAGTPAAPAGAAAAGKGGKPGGGAPVPVTVAAAERRAVPVTIEAVGTVEPLASVAVKSRVDGQIVEVLVADGQDVTRNQKLLQIDARPFQIQLQEASANLARDQALVATAAAQEKRYRELQAQGYVSPDDYAGVKSKLDTAQAAVSSDQAAIDTARLQLDYAAIRAPISGRLGRIALQRGNLVKANDNAPIVTINQVNPIYVAFAVPEQSLAAVREAMRRGALAAQARREGVAEPLSGRLTFVDNAVDTATGTIRLRATFDNPRGVLWPGQYVGVALGLGEDAAALVVPPQAVQTGPKGTYVFVVGGDQTAQPRPVRVARTTPDAAVIAEGLQPGESVVTDGQSRLAAGTRVAVKTAAAAAPATP
ncbi:MAG TPA: efflux RND transporter periplasmic adaptor subunit [Candidatus Binatia bacterium]|nr:efflux RND transporter periplasmic adaptor subunit [Candidatus Binatia bacterium]